MADIELVIKIPEEEYEMIINSEDCGLHTLTRAIAHGTILPKGHGALKDTDKIEDITWQEPYYRDALNVLSEIRDKIRNQRTIIEADKNVNEEKKKMREEKPYIVDTITIQKKKYNPNYGDNRMCVCGHTYYRHFDPWDDMEAVGCKYCGCEEFIEADKAESEE